MNCLLVFKQSLVIFLAWPVVLSYAAVYSDTWAVHVEGGEEIAKALASKHGFHYAGKIMDDYYELRHHQVSKRSVESSSHVHQHLTKEPQVKWLEQQQIKSRVKRDTMPGQEALAAASTKQKRHVNFNDPKWPRMWYLSRTQGKDMNVVPAWDLGYTGKGVVITILDDGIEKDHPDLRDNYDAGASYDVNGRDPDPQPRYDYSNENRHGTRCAGEVAAKANNQLCGLGVAYDAGIGGVRMLDGDVTDSVEAQSLSLYPQHIDIYSASWGPDDDGKTVDGPGILAKKAFFDGITKGRNGRGSIFVWASGNGGRDRDNCNCDGYTNSIYTLSISSATEHLKVPWYSEACSSTLATTYSSGSGGEREIVTTDLRKSCTERHTGTSASAPLAAGVCALALQANPSLTWRDLQHIVVKTARPEGLQSTDWVTNGVGRKVSHSFGYGLMDAAAMVREALNWTSVPRQHMCRIPYKGGTRSIKTNGNAHLSLYSDGCQRSPHEVIYLEHVQATITLNAVRRGELKIYLTSPAGTKSTLLAQRAKDRSTEGFSNWAFMTTHSWGEHSVGTWTLEIDVGDTTARLTAWKLVLYGTGSDPYAPVTSTSATTTTSPPSTQAEMHLALSRQRSLLRNDIKAYDGHATRIVKVGPCKPPQPAIPATDAPASAAPSLVLYEVHSHSTARPVPASTAEVRNWSLVMYGTAADPDLGHNGAEEHPGPNYPGTPTESDCSENEYFLNNFCYKECPAQYFPSNRTSANQSAATARGFCESCYQVCLQCFGPGENECMKCNELFVLTKDHRCERTPVNSGHQDKAFLIVTVAFCSVAIVLFALIFVFLQSMEHGYWCFAKKRAILTNRGDQTSNHQELLKKAAVNGRKDAERPELAQQREALLDPESDEETAACEIRGQVARDIP